MGRMMSRGMTVDEFDLIIIGSGAGMNLVDPALRNGWRVALVENGPLGGTCLNRGCIPSKMWIYPADVIRTITEGAKLGIHAHVDRIDFDLIRKRMWDVVLRDRHHMEEAVKQDPVLKFYPVTGTFIADRTLQVGTEQIHGARVVISAGVRSFIPDIPGLKEIPYQTSETVFDITTIPGSMIFLGGGYKSCELGHFFSALGSSVSIIQHNVRLLPKEEPEVSQVVWKIMSGFMHISLNQDIVSVRKNGRGVTVVRRDRLSGKIIEESADMLFLGTGEKSNTDLLRPEVSGVKMDASGYVQVNEFLETTAPGVWAFGDITGLHMFRHTANFESQLVWNNMTSNTKVPVDEHSIPHAVYTYPTVGSVGLTEKEAFDRGYKFLIGYKRYQDVAKGQAMGDTDGMAKVIVEKGTSRILGAHIVGPQADLLVQQVVYMMNCGDQSYYPMSWSQIIHPALSEVLGGAFANLIDPQGHEHHR
jgi:mycothione reductase